MIFTFFSNVYVYADEGEFVTVAIPFTVEEGHLEEAKEPVQFVVRLFHRQNIGKFDYSIKNMAIINGEETQVLNLMTAKSGALVCDVTDDQTSIKDADGNIKVTAAQDRENAVFTADPITFTEGAGEYFLYVTFKVENGDALSNMDVLFTANIWVLDIDDIGNIQIDPPDAITYDLVFDTDYHVQDPEDFKAPEKTGEPTEQPTVSPTDRIPETEEVNPTQSINEGNTPAARQSVSPSAQNSGGNDQSGNIIWLIIIIVSIMIIVICVIAVFKKKK